MNPDLPAACEVRDHDIIFAAGVVFIQVEEFDAVACAVSTDRRAARSRQVGAEPAPYLLASSGDIA